jgi:glycerophosphoryl diester phosphodiesterase
VAPLPRVIGHRGARRLAVENTLEALRIALAEGADGVEFDVQLTQDGELVLFHDDHLLRLARRPGRVTERTWRDLRAMPLHETGLATQPIAHLDEALELLDAKNAWVNAEIKVDGHAGDGVALAEALGRRLEGLDTSRWLVSSFRRAPIQRLHDASSGLALAALIEAHAPLRLPKLPRMARPIAPSDADWWPLADEGQVHGLRLASVNPSHTLVNDERMARWRDAGWQVWPWTVNGPRHWEAMLLAGVDAIITDDPGGLVHELARNA